MPGYRVEVVDLGLRLEDGLAMGLQPETFTRKKALPGGLRLTEREQQAFVGRRNQDFLRRKASWICERIEINAMTSPQMIDYIEDGLTRHSATQKIVPPDARVRFEASERASATLRSLASEEIERRLDIAALVDRFMATEAAQALLRDATSGASRDAVRKRIEENRPEWWKTATGAMSEAPIRAAEQEIVSAIEVMLRADE